MTLVYVLYTLYRHVRRQRARRCISCSIHDQTSMLLLWHMASSTLGTLHHSTRFITQAGLLQYAPSIPRNVIIQVSLGFSAAFVFLGYLQLSVHWIALCEATSRLRAVDVEALRKARRYVAMASAVFLTITIVLLGLAGSTHPRESPFFLGFIGWTMVCGLFLVATNVVGMSWLRRLLARASIVASERVDLARSDEQAAESLESKVRAIAQTSHRITVCLCFYLLGAGINIAGSTVESAVVVWIGALMLCAAKRSPTRPAPPATPAHSSWHRIAGTAR
jgi:hypothetical protein